MPVKPGDSSSQIDRGDAGRLRNDRLDVQAPLRPMWRYHLTGLVLRLVTKACSRVSLEGIGQLPAGPAVLCFSHQSWADPFYVIAALPAGPRCHFFGPEQEDMRRGFRNRLMRWNGMAIPYQPGRRGLVAAMRRSEELLAQGDRVAIAGEGRIHAGEKVVLPLLEGPAYIAIRAGVPIVPVAINGTSWLGFRRRVRLRFGQPIAAGADRTRVAEITAQLQNAMTIMVADFDDPAPPGPLGRWLTELFNDWPEGDRPPVDGA